MTRRWIAVAVVAWTWSSAVAARAAEPTVRLAVLHDGELLRSEARALAEASRQAKGMAIARVDATPAERAILDGASKVVPKEWAAMTVVVVLEIMAPTGKNPGRLSRGLGRVAMFRPPSLEPLWSESVEGPAWGALDGASLAKWIAVAAHVGAK
jgi:hypothetical protein